MIPPVHSVNCATNMEGPVDANIMLWAVVAIDAPLELTALVLKAAKVTN